MTRPELTKVWMEAPVLPVIDALLQARVEMVPAAPAPARPWSNALDCQAVMASSLVQYNAELFQAWPNLNVIARMGIGIDNISLPDATAHGVLVINTPDGPTESTAEHAIALLLGMAKRLKQGNDNLAAGLWGPRVGPLFGTEVQGKTIAVIGLGRIGRRVAEICRLAFQMRVLGYDPMVSIEQAAAWGIESCPIDEMIPQAEFVTVHAPSLPETRHMIDARRLGMMKDGAYLINVARGPLIDEAALLAELDKGRLGGVGLDVFEVEPPALDNRLRNHPMVLATPHMASLTAEGRERMERMAVERLFDFYDGKRPKDICNPAVYDELYA